MTAVLYGGQGSVDTTTDLYSIAPGTGVCTSIGPVGMGLTGLASDPTSPTSLYGATNSNSAVNPNALISIDTTTGAGTLIGAFGHNVADIAFDNTGQLYGIDGSLKKLYRINKATGAVTIVGTIVTSGRGNGFAIDSVNNARLFQVDNVYSVDLTTAAEALVGSNGLSAPQAAGYDASDVLWVVDGGFLLFTVDPSTGATTPVSTLSLFQVDALGWGVGGGGGGGPTITSFLPTFGPVGTEVTITGTGFSGATAVLFDGVNAPTYVVDSPTQIRVLVPAGATSGPITVTTPGGSALSADSFSVTSGSRFFEGYPWRLLFTAIDVSDPDNPDVVVTTSWAQGLLTNRQITKALGQPTTIEADVWPDHVTVNEVWTDGYPRVAQTKRIVWAFRREGAAHVPDEVSPPNGPWVCRAAGILMQPEDEGDPDVPLTHFIAYDPRKWLEARPAKDNTGNLPGPNGFTTVSPVPGNTLALLYLKNTITFDGGVFIDAGVANGGTAFYDGTIETTPDVAFTVQQGSSVADIWNQLEQAGNMDIILDPIYDPVNRPGYTHQVSIYNLAGSVQHSAVFGWDRMNRCITKIQRLHDATPGNFFDIISVHAGQGGAPVPLTGPSVGSGTINAAALAAFGSYWMIQFFPTMLSVDPTGAAVLQLAVQALQMAKQGRRTLTMEITPERGPIPLIDYDLGDRVDIRVSKVLRVAADGLQRVEAMPFQIDDNGIEHLPGLLVSPDWRGSGDS